MTKSISCLLLLIIGIHRCDSFAPLSSNWFASGGSMTSFGRSNVCRRSTGTRIRASSGSPSDESTEPTIDIVTGELEKGVARKTVGGAALAATTLSAIKGVPFAVSGAAGVSAAVLAVSKGLAGEAIRQVGDATWDAGEEVVNLARNPFWKREVRRVNSAVSASASTLLEKSSRERTYDKCFRADNLLRDLDQFKTDVFATYDELYKDIEALDALEMEMVQSSGQYKRELNSLRGQVEQAMRDAQKNLDSR